MNPPFRYKRLGYVALNVTDLPRSTAFYRDLVGLDVSAESASFVALRCSRDHHSLLLYPAAEPGLKRIAFELESAADLARAREHLLGLGLEVEPVSAEEKKALRRAFDALKAEVEAEARRAPAATGSLPRALDQALQSIGILPR